MIEIQRDADQQLTVFTCTGPLTPAEVTAELSSFYDTTPTLHTIWNYTDADLSALTADRISDLAELAVQDATIKIFSEVDKARHWIAS